MKVSLWWDSKYGQTKGTDGVNLTRETQSRNSVFRTFTIASITSDSHIDSPPINRNYQVPAAHQLSRKGHQVTCVRGPWRLRISWPTLLPCTEILATSEGIATLLTVYSDAKQSLIFYKSHIPLSLCKRLGSRSKVTGSREALTVYPEHIWYISPPILGQEDIWNLGL